MALIDIFKNKKDIQSTIDRVDIPLFYVENDFITEINFVAKKLLQFDVSKDAEIPFSQFCKIHNYSLVKFIEDIEPISNTHEEIYIINNDPHVIQWRIIKFSALNEQMNGYLFFGCNLSKERCAVDDLRKTESFYNHILSNLPTNVYWKDENCIYMGCNDRLAKVLGLASRDAIKGMTDYDFKWEVAGAAEKFIEFDKEVMRTKKSLTTEDTFAEANGNIVTVLTNKTPLIDENDNVSGVLAISVDITEHKKNEKALKEEKEKAEAASQAKTEFLQNMRHDIRTPLTGIIGFANIIAEETNDPKIKEYIANLMASSNALLDLMNEVLEIVRFAAGEAPIYKNKFDLKKRIQEVIDLNLAKAQEKNIEMTLYYDPTLPQYVVGDSKRVHRIILELVANALNFTNKGLVNISVRLAEKNEHELIIKILVEDTGIGIPLEKQHEIFARFKRLHPSFEGIYKGAGLGLAFVHQMMDDIKGEIYVESKEGKGSTFICIFPLHEALLQSEEGVELELEPNTTIKASHKTLLESVNLTDQLTSLSRVLVVEDQEVASRVAKNILQLSGCDVDTAADGISAVKMAAENQYDMILMDVGLPDISGMEATKRIRVQEWNTERPVPIIALTAHVDGEDKQRCIEAGMNAVLSKPLSKPTATDILDAFIPMRSVKKQIAAMAATQKEEEKKLLDLSNTIIDNDIALQMSGGNEDFLNEMLKALVDSFQDETIHMLEAHALADWKTIGAIAHKIKGGCSYCGVVRLLEASANLERYLKSDTIGELNEALYRQMLTEMETLQHEVANRLAVKNN